MSASPNVASVAYVAAKIIWRREPGEMALHGLAGEVVRVIGPHSEGDPWAILIQFLAAAGNIVGSGLHCRVEATRHPLLIHPIVVGETAKARKGTSWGHIRNLFAEVDECWERDRVTSGLSSAEGLIQEVSDSSHVDKRLLVVQGEYASVLKMMARDGNTLSPTLRDAWDSGDLRTIVKFNPLKSTRAHISVIGHITKDELLRYLSDTEAHNGFANRLLWTYAERSKLLPEGGAVPQADMSRLASLLSEVCEWVNQLGEFEIKRDKPSRELWAQNYGRLSGGVPGLLGAATARAEAQVLRLSAIYAVLDRSTVVKVEHLKAAYAVWDYCFASAKHIFGDATGDVIAERILTAIREAGEEGLSRTAIRNLFSKHESATRIEQALRNIAERSHAAPEKMTTDGRPVQLWRATKATEATKERSNPRELQIRSAD